MDEREERVRRLSRARRADSDDRRQRVLAVIDELEANSRPLPIAELARRANVHRSFLYRHPDLYELAVATPLRKHFAELVDERDRLRAVVEAMRNAVLGLRTDVDVWAADALAQLDVSPTMGDTGITDQMRLEVTSEYLRTTLEDIARTAGISVMREDEGPKANEHLVHDIMGWIEGARASTDLLTTALAAHYLSTYCMHGHHDDCRLECKTCKKPCRCPCHASGPMGGQVSVGDDDFLTVGVVPADHRSAGDANPGAPPEDPSGEIVQLLREALDAAISYVFALEGQGEAVVIRARRSYEAALDALEEAEPSDGSPVGSPGSHVAAVPPTGGRDVGTGNPGVPPEVRVWHLIDLEAEKLTGIDRNVVTGWLDGTIRPLLLGPDEDIETVGARIKREGEEGRHILLDRMKAERDGAPAVPPTGAPEETHARRGSEAATVDDNGPNPWDCCGDALFWCPTMESERCGIHDGYLRCCTTHERHVSIPALLEQVIGPPDE